MDVTLRTIITAVVIELIRDIENAIEYLTYIFETEQCNWLAIGDYTEISAYYDKSNIFTILRFPLITQPTYNVINVIALPVFSQNNVMTETEIKNEIIALDKEELTYIKLKRSDLEKCININSQYLCTNALPRYRVSANAPCEVQIYTRHYQPSCNLKHTVANETV